MLSQAQKVVRMLTSLLVVCGLTACASGARTGAMTASLNTQHILDAKSPLYNAITITSVTGGSKTNPLWKSNVSNEDFRAALEQSLELNTLLAKTGGKYNLSVTLNDLVQPLVGFNSTVTAVVHYVVAPAAGGTPIFDQIITSPYTANFSDAFLGVERLRLANEGAMRQSISDFISAIEKNRPSVPGN